MDAHAANQARTFLELFAGLRMHLRSDRNLPARIQAHIGRERRFGSRDRRFYRELLYTAIRYLPWFEAALTQSREDALRLVAWLAADVPAVRAFKIAFTPAGWPSLPPTIAARAAQLGEVAKDSLVPEWFRAHSPASFESPEVETLHTRAPLWLRLQTGTPARVFDEFDLNQWQWRMSEVLPDAVEVLTDPDLTQTEAHKAGLLEVQDLGSQLILASVAPEPGGRWLDACAGAGGKTLQLGRLLGPAGHVTAHDVRHAALDELQKRVARAGLANVSVSKSPAGLFDGVLVDAPCSGTGTWRRSPHLKWSTTEADVTSAAKLQRELLGRFAKYVRPGGRLLYATCSLSRVENEDVASAFLDADPQFAAAPLAQTFGLASTETTALTIRPSVHNTDGFFVASFRRRS